MAWVTKNSSEEYTAAQPQREYTKAEKAKNWWHYQRWFVLGGLALAVMAGWIIKDTLFRTQPDYQVAWVGVNALPEDTAAALTAALEGFCDDRNGDGKTVVQLNQYQVDFDEQNAGTDAYNQMAGVTRLSTDLSGSNGSYIYLLEDPAGFEAGTAALAYLDGTTPAEGAADWQAMCLRWADCPVLAGLELGSYTGVTLMDDLTGSSQEIFKNCYVARRTIDNDKAAAYFAVDETLWDTLTAGAAG